MVRAEKITAGPVGKGTRFRSAVASRGRTAEMLIECTGYDRPALLATTTTMQQADISYTLRFERVAAGTRMRWLGQVHPKGAFRLLGPVITWMGIRQEQRIWTSLKNTWKQRRRHRRGRNRRDRTGSERTGQGAVAEGAHSRCTLSRCLGPSGR
jgi:hypothetical protein